MVKLKWAECTYCGDTATSCDHVVPLSWESKTGKRDDAVYGQRSKTVPCCAECNSLLSNRPLFTITDRAAFLAQRIAQRYKKALNYPVWSDYEISLLGKTLRTAVVARQYKRQKALDRVRNCLFVASMVHVSISDVWASYDSGKPLDVYLAELHCSPSVFS